MPRQGYGVMPTRGGQLPALLWNGRLLHWDMRGEIANVMKLFDYRGSFRFALKCCRWMPCTHQVDPNDPAGNECQCTRGIAKGDCAPVSLPADGSSAALQGERINPLYAISDLKLSLCSRVSLAECENPCVMLSTVGDLLLRR